MSAISRRFGRESVLNIPWEKVVGVVAAGVILYLVAVPLGMLLFSSVRDTKDKLPFEETAFTLENYAVVFTSDATYRLFVNTLWYALGSLVVCIALATAFAWFLERGKAPFRSVLLMLVLAPMATPMITEAVGWALLASPSTGLINVALRPLLGITGNGPFNIYTLPGMILVTGLSLVPSAYIMLSGPIARFDPVLEEASLTSRVSTLGTIWRVTFPLLRPAFLAALVYFLVLVLEIFEIAAILGIPYRIFVFSTLIYDAMHPAIGLPNFGQVSVYATVFLVIAGVLIYLYGRVTSNKEQFSVITGRGYRAKLFEFGKWKWVFVALIVLYFTFAVLLPLAVLVWTSLGLIYRPLQLSSLEFANLNAYRQALDAPEMMRSISNTAIIALVAATGTMVLATMASWLSTRSKFRWAAIPDRLTITTLATPSVVTALALIFVYVWLPLPIYGTIWIVVIGLSTRYLSYATRLMGAAYLQIHKELEEASLVSRVRELQTIVRIVVPLIWPSFARGWLWVFVHAIKGVTIPLMLFTVANDTIGVRLWRIWFSDANMPQASAIAVCLILVSMVLTFFVARLTPVGSQNQ